MMRCEARARSPNPEIQGSEVGRGRLKIIKSSIRLIRPLLLFKTFFERRKTLEHFFRSLSDYLMKASVINVPSSPRMMMSTTRRRADSGAFSFGMDETENQSEIRRRTDGLNLLLKPTDRHHALL